MAVKVETWVTNRQDMDLGDWYSLLKDTGSKQWQVEILDGMSRTKYGNDVVIVLYSGGPATTQEIQSAFEKAWDA